MSELTDYIHQFQMEEKSLYEELSTKIWEHPETAYKEYYASSLQKEFLKERGFEIDETRGDVPCTVYASYGSGKPVLAFLGEYDALPGMSQISDIHVKSPVKEGAPGHACGHNLIGTASLEAAVITAGFLKEKKIAGTVVYIGCPGEESGAGKAFMLRERYFEDVDFVFTWHPNAFTGMMRGTLANVRMRIKFRGKKAHAAASPWDGRSALDACELTNIGVNYLREHVRPEIRMHYAYLNSGGLAPNIVPDEAELIYALRAPKDQMLLELTDRFQDIVKGAALMTGTEAEVKTLSYYGSVFGVPSLDELIYQILSEKYKEHQDEESCGVNQKVLGFYESGSSFSTDAGNVSQKIPMGIFNLATYSKETSLHTWLATAQGVSSCAHRGMHLAAEIMTEAALTIFRSESLQSKIKKEFKELSFHSYDDILFPETTTIEDVREILP